MRRRECPMTSLRPCVRCVRAARKRALPCCPPRGAAQTRFGWPGVAVIQPRRLGIAELAELEQGLVGSPRASALAAVDRRYQNNALIVADLSYDPTYAEVLHETFGPRVIGLQISRHGDGMQAERRIVRT